MPIVLKYGNPNLLEPSGPVRPVMELLYRFVCFILFVVAIVVPHYFGVVKVRLVDYICYTLSSVLLFFYCCRVVFD
jgi:hypothetical protein